MPVVSRRLDGILGAGKSGWEVHFTALARKNAGEDILMLSIGDHDFATPDASVEACVSALRAGHHHYTALAGMVRLRNAMAAVSQRSTGVATQMANILATPGGQGALYAAVQAALDPGEHAIIVNPYYATYPGTFRAAGASFDVVEARAEDDFQPRRAALEAAVRPNSRALLINSPNNPTGAVYTAETIRQIALFCIEHDLWLISDEVYWTFAGAGGHLSPIAVDGMEERTLIVNSVSKSHGMTGWRVGWLRAPTRVIDKLVNFNLVVTYGLADFVSHAVAEALERDIGLADIARLYASRNAAFKRALASVNSLTIRGSQGGMYVMLDVRAVEADAERFCFDLLEAENMAIMPGESFGEASAGHVRISMCQSEEMLEEAARRLIRFVKGRQRQSAAAS